MGTATGTYGRAAAMSFSARRTAPSIDDALDEESAKRAFWTAFRKLGEWYADFPPY